MNWPKSRLADLTIMRTGKLDSNESVENGKYPFFTCSQETLRIDKAAFDTKAVLLGGNNAAGIFPLKYYDGEFNAYQRTYVIESVGSDVLNTRYLFYALRPSLVHFQSVSIGAATQYLTKGILDNFQIALPPILLQNRIASVLSAYDDLIENNLRRIALLEKSARLLYEEWFVRLRFPGHDCVRIRDGVPDGWKREKIGDVSITVGGGTPSTRESAYWDDGDISWITPTDVTRNNCLVLLESEKKITAEGLKRSSAKMLPPNAILMTSRASVGFFCLVDKEVCTNQGFINIIPNEEYLGMYLLHNLMNRREEILSHARGSTYREINKTTFRFLDILIPTEDIVEAFYKLTYACIEQTRLLQRQNQKLKQARDLLLPRLMNGEITV